jgi:hypothetical protein
MKQSLKTSAQRSYLSVTKFYEFVDSTGTVYYTVISFFRWKEEAESKQVPLVFPRKWMLPNLPTTASQLIRDQLGLFPTNKDPAVVRILAVPKEATPTKTTTTMDKQLEVTLDTSQYRPDELSINVVGEGRERVSLVLVVEGRHSTGELDEEEGEKLVAEEWRWVFFFCCIPTMVYVIFLRVRAFYIWNYNLVMTRVVGEIT